jgi:iduronate 2-sulfatase
MKCEHRTPPARSQTALHRARMKSTLPSVLLVCAILRLLGGTSTVANARPNVLFIVCDDLNTHVSTSGYPHIQTPAFDRLAAAGMTFRRAYCQYPVCGPSRASFLSGLYPQSTGVLNNSADICQTRPGTISMPQRFREAGYWTARVGKIFHTAITNPNEAWDQNPERFQNDELPMVARARKQFEVKHGPIDNPRLRKAWKKRSTTLGTQVRGQKKPGYGPTGLTDDQHKDGKNATQVAKWLDSKAYGDKPFFIACGIQKPHVPFLAPDKYFTLYPRESLKYTPAPPGFWDQAPKTAVSHRYKGFGFELNIENDPLRRAYIQAYHACVTFLDAQILRVLDAVERNGHGEDTIIILTSDHGYQLGEHFMWGKVTLFEVCARVPLVIRVPETIETGATMAGATSEALVELLDLYPTLAELCDVKAPALLQGRSLVPMLQDPSASGKEVAYTVVKRGEDLGKAIRMDRWRYAKWSDGEELYDLHADPRETRNLARSEPHSATLQTLRAKLAETDARAKAKRR